MSLINAGSETNNLQIMGPNILWHTVLISGKSTSDSYKTARVNENSIPSDLSNSLGSWMQVADRPIKP